MVLINLSNSSLTSSSEVSPVSANSKSTSISLFPKSRFFHNFISFSNNEIFFKCEDAEILSFQKSGDPETKRNFSNFFCFKEKSKIPP